MNIRHKLICLCSIGFRKKKKKSVLPIVVGSAPNRAPQTVRRQKNALDHMKFERCSRYAQRPYQRSARASCTVCIGLSVSTSEQRQLSILAIVSRASHSAVFAFKMGIRRDFCGDRPPKRIKTEENSQVNTNTKLHTERVISTAISRQIQK